MEGSEIVIVGACPVHCERHNLKNNNNPEITMYDFFNYLFL